LAKALDDYSELRFVQAKAMLGRIDPQTLSADDRQTWGSYVKWVDVAIERQTSARDELLQGEQALAAGEFDTAREHFADAYLSEFLDLASRQRAREGMAKAQRLLSEGVTPEPQPEAPVAEATDSHPAEPVVQQPPVSDEPITLSELGGASELDEMIAVDIDIDDELPDLSDLLVAEAPAVTSEDTEGEGSAPTAEPAADAAAGDDDAAAADDTVGEATGEDDVLTRLEERRRIAAQQVMVDFGEAMRRATELQLAAKTDVDFKAAQQAVLTAKDALARGRSYLEPEDYKTHMTQADNRLKYIEDEFIKWQDIQEEKLREDIRKEEEARAGRIRRQREEKILALQSNAETLIVEQRFDEALDMMEQILELNPQHPFAVERLDLLKQLVNLRKNRDIRETMYDEEAKVRLELEETKIPWHKLLTYPQDWKELTLRRKPFGLDEGMESEADRQVYLRLRQKIDQPLEFDGIPFGEVIDFLQDYSGLNFHVKWDALQGADVSPDTEVKVKRLSGITLEKVLRVILEDVSSTGSALSFVVDDGVITISTRDDLRVNKIARVYDIRDMIIRVPDFIGPRVDLSKALEQADTGGGSFMEEDDEDDGEMTRSEIVEALIETVTTTIDPESWDADASIQELRGQLIITQTPENHRAILDLLAGLREARAIQISIESRFIEVTTGFLERVGVDLDVFLNIGSRNRGSMRQVIDDDVSDIPDIWATGLDPDGNFIVDYFLGNTTTDRFNELNINPQIAKKDAWSHRFSPISIEGGSKLPWIAGAVTATAGDIGAATTGVPTALSIAGSFLDDVQVDFLIEATQGNATTRLLVAPRLTLFNGQRAYITVATQQAYISGWEPLVAEGSAAMRPIIGYVPTGSVLDVEGTVSADRRYVTLTVRPQVAELQSIESVDFVVGGGIGVGTAAEIQLPEIAVKDLQTTVSVPDGGTLLLGGQKLAGEAEREVGPPVLSKIPVLNRFFTARSDVRDERTLLILIKPKIIIQREEEADAFPS
jgi:general secretion pathway protein D